ncbi:hypothetical protein [Ureibacillus sp. GCM10028918]|uniref:hypothetical protein n=1 Tax=Ureibacillus sp. GCM10028918 TaxID=3273429 RepID=UPI00360A251D
MIQLFFIGILLYAILFLLVKLNIFKGIHRVLSVVNTVVIIVFGIFILVKTGLLRMIATSISFLLIRLSELIASLF